MSFSISRRLRLWHPCGTPFIFGSAPTATESVNAPSAAASSTSSDPSCRVVITGMPGIGKTIYAKQLAVERNVRYLSNWELYDATRRQSKGLIASMRRGELLPDSELHSLMRELLLENTNTNVSYILEGYPQSIAQAVLLDSEPLLRPTHVLCLTMSYHGLLRRLMRGARCPDCARPCELPPHQTTSTCCHCSAVVTEKNLVSAPGKEEETVRHRIHAYHAQMDPVLQYYRTASSRLVEVSLDAPPTMPSVEPTGGGAAAATTLA
eukprot:PhM_4_TR533/c0_g1_i1/m.89133/K00939/adk, AK; adenylate kinase